MHCDIAIVGGGHTGLLLAASLAGSGLTLCIIDPAPPEVTPTPRDGRNLALLRGSRELAAKLGVWSALAGVTEPVQAVVVEERPGGARLVWGAREHGGEPFAYGVEHGRLRAALAGLCRERLGDEAFLATRLLGLRRQAGGVVLELADGRRLFARLAVGADGRGSQLRQLARIGLDRWQYGQAALAFIIATARPHDGTIREWLRPAGPLALLPLPEGRTGVTWVEPEARARALAALPAAELSAQLAQETEWICAGCRIDSPVSVWPLSAQHARRYVAPRVALVGDAAHGVHPIHAQGFNMAVADVAVLHGLLVDAAGRARDPGDPALLLAYERARRPANRQRIWMTDGLARIFSNDVPALRVARTAAMELMAQVWPLQRLAVRHGTRLL